jgi:predicted DNA-binding transcriptional regulator YafY
MAPASRHSSGFWEAWETLFAKIKTTLPADFDAEAFMKSSFGVFQGEPVQVRIHFDADVADYIRERTWHPSQSIKPRPDGSIDFEAEVAGTREIKYWILQWVAHAEVLSPPELREDMIAESLKLSAVYRAGETA